MHDERGVADMVNFAIGFVRRQYLIILFAAFFATSIGVSYVVLTPPTYTANAKLIADIRKGEFFRQRALIADAPISSPQIDSQLQILKSENIAEAVIKDLHLMQDPEFVQPSGGILSYLIRPIHKLFDLHPNDDKSEAAAMRRVVDVFEKKLDVGRVGDSYVIEVSFQSQSPERAAQIANAVTKNYILQSRKSQTQANQQISDWLEGRLKGVQKEVSAADRAVNTFKKDHKIISAKGAPIEEQKLSELSSQLNVASGRTSEARAKLLQN